MVILMLADNNFAINDFNKHSLWLASMTTMSQSEVIFRKNPLDNNDLN